MNPKYIAAIPEVAILLGLLVMFAVNLIRKSNTPKTFFTLSKITLGCNSTPLQVAFTLTVGSLTVDDLHPLAVFDNIITSMKRRI